ncbi:TPA: hypothetical protein MEX11_002703 [Klebsiella pneumoniae]|uniref:hypothetical protein n=1 Tax=Klebsiella pneumoniae TaxID=573 RepID=UPI003740E46B|nr:hypothetical protein [Klebsiella pneumoniae]HBW3212751.1 hypothetical protein [Klebsiella pneumoniae]HCI6052846.1 hypothetical protein [Klebsiella pneumoniae]
MMNLTPYKNGVHSLAEGLRCLNQFVNDDKNPYLMKEVIIKIHHGMETLLKDILFQKNPVFLLVEKTTISQILEFYKGFYEGKNEYLFDDAKTITPEETIKRMSDLKIISGINNKDYQQIIESFKSLNADRNKLQHFAIKANSDAIIRTLANLIPGMFNILKGYYMNQNGVRDRSRVNLIPHQPLPEMEQLFGELHDIEADLNGIYADSTKVISMIEAKYGRLLNEAIKKLQGSVSEKTQLTFKLSDYGKVGAPPYVPSIILEGWLREHFDAHRNATSSMFFRYNEALAAIYDSSLNISQPEVLEKGDEWYSDTVSAIKFSCDTSIEVLNSGIFDVPSLSEELAFLKSPKLNISLQVECVSKGTFDERHFIINKVMEIKGFLTVEMSSYIYGDPEGKPSINGVYKIELNKDNTSLKFNAFVLSNNKLADHHSLDIIVDDAADIVFKSPS